MYDFQAFLRGLDWSVPLQLLLSVLAGMGQQLFPQGAYAFLGAQGIINIQAASAAPGQAAAPDEDLPAVPPELCFELGLLPPLP